MTYFLTTCLKPHLPLRHTYPDMEKTYTISADLIKFSAALSVQTICGQINIIENDQSAAKLYYSRAQLAVEMLRFLIMEQQKPRRLMGCGVTAVLPCQLQASRFIRRNIP